MGGSSGTGGNGGTGGTVAAPTRVTSLTSASFKETSEPTGEGVQLVGLHITSEPSDKEFYTEMFGRLYNAGTKVNCYLQAEFTVKQGSMTIWEDLTFATTAPHLSEMSPVTYNCLAPGQYGGFFSNQFLPDMLDPTDVTEVTLNYKGLDIADAVLHPATPTLSEITSYQAFGKPGLKGKLTGKASIENIKVSFFLLSASKLPVGLLSALPGGTVSAGQTIDIDTKVGSDLPFDGYEAYVSFISLGSTNLAAPPWLSDAMDAAKASHQTVEARHRLHLQRTGSAR